MTEYIDFFDFDPGCIAIFEALRDVLLEKYPDMQVFRQKTCLSFRDPRPFCYVSRAKAWNRKKNAERYVVLSFALSMPVPDERIHYCVQVTPNRFTHHVAVGSVDEIDDQLLAWLHMARRLKDK